MEPLFVAFLAFDSAVALYLLAYFALNFWFVSVSWRRVRRDLVREDLRPPASDEHNRHLPTLSLLVPAFNEEVTCVDSVRSLLGLRYPRYEIIVCNDGSTDATVDVLRKAFGLVRSDVNYRAELVTAPLRAMYQATVELPPNVMRLVLLDKDNGGKADALNAAINASQGSFVASMDADSVLEPTALLRAMQAVADDPNGTIAVGTQVGLSNGSIIERGTLTRLGLPPRMITRFQVAEYMRSFTQARIALGQLNALLVLSGVFALLRRDLVVAAGGFLTRHVSGKVVNEYCGAGASTVCEDMEIVVRLYRYALDRGRPVRVAFDPHPAAWTEAPERYRDLGLQRSRWYRGLLEVLWLHRGMWFKRRYRQVGLLALPYQLLFEALAPLIEALGYVVVPATVLVGLIDLPLAVVLTVFFLTLNMALSSMSILLSIHERISDDGRGLTLFPYPRARDLARLLLASLLTNFGYRQYLLIWQLRGLRDFIRGRKEWDKFARKGSVPPSPHGTPAHIAGR